MKSIDFQSSKTQNHSKTERSSHSAYSYTPIRGRLYAAGKVCNLAALIFFLFLHVREGEVALRSFKYFRYSSPSTGTSCRLARPVGKVNGRSRYSGPLMPSLGPGAQQASSPYRIAFVKFCRMPLNGPSSMLSRFPLRSRSFQASRQSPLCSRSRRIRAPARAELPPGQLAFFPNKACPLSPVISQTGSCPGHSPVVVMNAPVRTVRVLGAKPGHYRFVRNLNDCGQWPYLQWPITAFGRPKSTATSQAECGHWIHPATGRRLRRLPTSPRQGGRCRSMLPAVTSVPVRNDPKYKGVCSSPQLAASAQSRAFFWIFRVRDAGLLA